jgi:hypothetical protein
MFQGDLMAARLLFERALTVREKVLGPEHPDTAVSLSNIARLLNNIGQVNEAEPLVRSHEDRARRSECGDCAGSHRWWRSQSRARSGPS